MNENEVLGVVTEWSFTSSRLRKLRAKSESDETTIGLNCGLLPLRVMRTKLTVFPESTDDEGKPGLWEGSAAARAPPSSPPMASAK